MISGSDRSSRLITCLAAAHRFMLSDIEARAIIDAQVEAINSFWETVCDEADLSPIDRALFKDRLFLHAYGFEGYGG